MLSGSLIDAESEGQSDSELSASAHGPAEILEAIEQQEFRRTASTNPGRGNNL